MKIHLISHTVEPLKSIAAAILNIGIGKDITSLDEITYDEAKRAVEDTMKSYLTSPLEYASFNFFWQDLPLFMRSELERARVGWSYAERSLRFYQANERDPVDKIDWKYFPSVKTPEQRDGFLAMANRHMEEYEIMKADPLNLETQDARNAIGPWFGTALQTSCNYRALRDTMALRLSSQAHNGWQDAAGQIKKLVTEVDKVLGDNLTDICNVQGRCVWFSRLDRECENCKLRGKESNHQHNFSLVKKNGETQCSCGILKSEYVNSK